MSIFLTPPLQKGKEPPFYEMGEMPFQELCRDLVAVQEEYVDCRVYGDRGQKQYGIDIRCDRKSGYLEVAQSKCYEAFSHKDIVKASKDFLDHIDYWLAQGVKKFILIVASRVTSTQAGNQIVIERQKFRDLGIAYELWDAVRIRDILRENPKLIFTHIQNPEFWAKEICGYSFEPAVSSGTSFGINLWSEPSLVVDMSSIINAETSKQLDENRIYWREGKGEAVICWIEALKNSDKWNAISGEIKAGVLRFEAVINIDYYENYLRAKQLIEDAKKIDPTGFDLRVRSILAFHQYGPQAGLEIISDAEDVDSICVQASLLLHLDRSNEAISLLETVQSQNNAEVYRLLALAYLNTKNLEKAISFIQQAKQIVSSWESIQITDAIIAYFSALSPAFIPDAVFVWPVPVELDLIKSNDDAIRSLERASEIFLKISQNKYKADANKLSLLIWYAACLACDFRKQEYAEKIFGGLISDYPTDHRLIYWAVVRKFSINLHKSQSELKKLCKKGLANTANIISSVMLHIHAKQSRNVIYLLENNKKVFIEDSSEHLFEYWRIQALIAQGKLVEARNRLEESVFHVELEPLNLMLLNLESKKNGNDQPFIDFILYSIEQRGHPIYLLDLCKYYASKQEWKLVARYADKLVSEIQTYESFRLASFALYNHGEFLECKNFIEMHMSICFENKLSDDMNRVHIQSKALTGEFPEALSDLRHLTENNPTVQNLVLLRDFYMRKGDQAGLRYVVTLAKEKTNIGPDDLITFANSVFWASRELAKELWRMAPADRLSSQKLAEKMLLGFALGLDHEIKDINNLLPQIAGKKGAPFRQVTEIEAISIIQKQNRQRDELFRLYSTGEIPIHVLAKNTGFNLYTFYKNIIRYNNDLATPISQKFPLYIRFGGRQSLTDFKEPESAFEMDHSVLDVTSILLLDHFSLLEILETKLGSIQIPSSTVLSLVQMKDDLQRYQVDVAYAYKLISDYLVEKKIREIEKGTIRSMENRSEGDRLMDFVSNLGDAEGYIVGFGSQLSDWNTVSSRHGKNLKFVSCSDIIESLRTNDLITESEKAFGIDRLGTDGQIRANILIPRESNLYFIANTITQIAQTGVFDRICDNYALWIENNEILNIRSSIKDERDRQTFALKLQELIDRISRGLEVKKYVFLPYSKFENDDAKVVQNDLLIQNLLEIIHFGQEPNIHLVIDDLNIQKHLHAQETSLYGIYEIAWSLYKRGDIHETRYYDILNDFRKADLRYIPVSSDEVLFHLKQASIEANELIENTKLKTLRSYLSASLIYGKKPQVPSQPFDRPESLGEFEFLISLTHSVSYAVANIWKDNIPEDQKIIQSNWILDNIFLDFLTICEIIGWERELKDRLFLVALSLSEFFLNGLQFQEITSNISTRRVYFQWIYNRICEPRFKANPGLLEKTADYIKTSLAMQISDQAESEIGQVSRVLCERLYRDLPDPIKTLLDKDKEFLYSIGVEIINVIQLADIMFPAQIFWGQLAEVIAGESKTIQSVEPKSDIVFSPINSGDSLGATFIHPKSKQNVKFESADFVFLSNKNYDSWVDENADAFCELSRQQLQDLVTQIGALKDPAKRFEKLEAIRKSSIGNYYINLEEELANSHTLVFDRLLPSNALSLKIFFGLENSQKKASNSSNLLVRAAKNLRDQVGLHSTITRLSAFPIEMPSSLLKEIQSLPLGERSGLFSELSSTMITPVSRIHLIRILIEYSNEEDRTSKLINSFLNDGVENEINAFLMLLTWITNEIDGLSDAKNWSSDIKLLLSWGHTNQLFGILRNSLVPFDWLYTILREKITSLPFKPLFSEKTFIQEDIASSGGLNYLSFKLLGLSYALNGNSLPIESQNILFSEIFPWEQNILLPALDLMRDRSIFTNQLNSFMGNELSEASQRLFTRDDERLSILRNSSLKGLASLAIDWLREPPALSINGWQLLFGIYRSKALPEILCQSFDDNVSTFKFDVLARENPAIGFIGLFFSAYQANQLSKDSQNHLIKQISGLAKVGSELLRETEYLDKQSINKNEAVAMLLDAAFRLSLVQSNGYKMPEIFSAMVKDIVNNWEDTIPIVLRLVNRMISEAPIPTAQKLGGILLELRSKT